MKKSFCYAPTSVDKRISKLDVSLADVIEEDEDGFRVPGEDCTGAYCAILRGLYDEHHPNENTDWESMEDSEIIKKLGNFRKELGDSQAKTIRSNSANLGQLFYKLKQSLPSATIREDRINMIARYFSLFVSDYQAANPQYTREAITNGITLDDGTIAFGETAIFDELFKKICINMQECEAQGMTYIADELCKVLDNWESLVTLTRIKLRDTEGLLLGGKASYSAKATVENFEENYISEMFNMEEAIREGWQEIAEAVSAYSTLSTEVRRVLSTLPAIKDNDEADVDDIGEPKFLNPVQTYQNLLRITRGSVSSRHKLNLIKRAYNDGQKWCGAVLDALLPEVYIDEDTTIKIDPSKRESLASQYNDAKRKLAEVLTEEGLSQEEIQIELSRVDNDNFEKWRNITTFNNALGKTFNFLSTLKIETENGIIKCKNRLLNKPSNFDIVSSTLANITLGKVIGESASIYDREGNIDWEGIDALKKFIETDFIGKEGSIFGPTITAGTRKEKKAAIIRIAKALGIQMSQRVANSIINDKYSRNEFIDAVDQLYKFGLNDSSLSSMTGNKLSANKALKFKALNNPSKQGVLEEVIGKIATISAPFGDNITYEYRVPYFDKKGKRTTLSSDINPSYLSSKMDMIAAIVKTGNRKALRNYIEKEFFSSSFYAEWNTEENKWNIHSLWLKELYNSPTIGSGDNATFAPNSFAAQFMYKRFLGDDVHTGTSRFEKYRKKKHTLSMLIEFMGGIELSSKDAQGQYAYYSAFIQGDSGVSKYFKGKVYTGKEVLDNMYEVYEQELIRMKLTKESNSYLKNFERGYSGINNLSEKTTTFTLIPALNNYLTPKWEGDQLVIYKRNTNTIASTTDIKNAISESMKKSFEEYYSSLMQMGLLDKTTDGRYIYLQNYANPKYGKIKDKIEEEQLKIQLQKFFYNHTINMIAQIQMFAVEPGFFKGTKDLQKRYKGIHSSGISIDPTAFDPWNNEPVSDGIERCIYFDDIIIDAEETNEDFMEVIKNVFGKNSDIYRKYRTNSLTDGQGYRTLDSYRKVMIMAGGENWTANHENAYKEIKSIQAKGNLMPEDITKLRELAVIFQPIKPVLYSFEDLPCGVNDSMKVPVFHKYAEVVIIPELMPEGSKLKALAIAMQENNIDLVGSTTIVKSGGFGSTAFDYKINEQGLYVDKNNNVIPAINEKGEKLDLIRENQKKNPIFKSKAVPCEVSDISSALTMGYTHKLNYADYRIQTNVLNHINTPSLFGTQARKIGFSGVKTEVQNEARDRETFEHYKDYLKDKNGNPVKVNLGRGNLSELNGKRLLWLYNQLTVANILEGLNSFLSAIGNNKIVSEQLIQNIISNSKESKDYLLAYSLTGDGKFLVPLFESTMSHDTASVLLSILKKTVNKQKIAGGSAVQTSAWGINKVEKIDDGGLKIVTNKDKTNILYAECEIPFNFKVSTGKKGEEIQLDFNKYCNTNGTFKLTGRTIKIGDHEEPETLIESDYPGILDIIAYRIPTEAHYSMLNLRVKRCSIPTAGGTIKVPSQGTTIAGFDFDIDKLYLIRKEFTGFTEKEEKKIWNRIYADNPALKSQLLMIARKRYPEGLPQNITLDTFINEPVFEGIYDKRELIKEAAEKLMQEKKLRVRENYEYNPSIPCMSTSDIKGNGRIARNNMLHHIIRERLMDKETLETRYTPGSFDNAKNAAKALRILNFSDNSLVTSENLTIQKLLELTETEKDPEPNYDYSNPETITIYNEQNQVAGTLIGIFANQNINHTLATLLQSYVVNTPIAFGNHSEDGLTDLIHNPEAAKTTAEFLNASVDAVKDPVLNFLNLNEVTADCGAVLARLGYSTLEIGLLFNQPSIKYICEQVLSYSKSLNEAIKLARDKFPTSKDIDISNRSEILGSNRLIKNILMIRTGNPAKDGEEFKTYQGEIINLFEQIVAVKSEVGDFVNSTRWTASNAVKSRIGDMYAQQMSVSRAIEKQQKKEITKTSMVVAPGFLTLLSDGSYYNLQSKGVVIGEGTITDDVFDYMMSLKDNPFAYEQAMYDAYRKALQQLCSKYYPYETPLYRTVRNIADKISLYGVDGDMVENLHEDLMIYILSKIPGTRFSSSTLIRRGENFGEQTDIISSETYFKDIFAQKLFDLFKSGHPIFETPLFKAIKFEVVEETNYDGSTTNKVYINIPTVKMQTDEVDTIKESWEDILLNGNPMEKEIAEDLLFYNFFNSAFSYGPTSFSNAIPSILKANVVIGKTSNGSPLLYKDLLYAIQDGRVFSMTIGDTSKDFITQFIINNSDNRRLVDNIKVDLKTESGKFINRLVLNNGNPIDVFEVSSKSTKKVKDNPFIKEIIKNPGSGQEISVFKAAVKINNTLYICDNKKLIFNETEEDTPITYYKVILPENTSYNADNESSETIDDEIFNSINSGNTITEEWIEPVVPTTGLSAEEQALIDTLKPEVRAIYESLSDDKKQEILEGIKSKKCYEVVDGQITEAIC